MKSKLIGIAALVLVLSGCAGAPQVSDEWQRVSASYQAAGDVGDARAYEYGGVTVLELPGTHLALSVYDATGTAVPYERMGQFYYRLPAALAAFSVRANFRTIHFERAFPHSAASSHAINAPSPAADIHPTDQPTGHAAFLALRAAVAAQTTTLAGLGAVSHSSDRAHVLVVTFPRMQAGFRAADGLDSTIANAAHIAKAVYVSGWTDSVVAGPLDDSIALARANAAAQFLRSNGIAPDKIHISHRAAGGFLIPGQSAHARAMNRRVELRFDFDPAVEGSSS